MRESLFLASETGAAESAAGIRPGDGFFISPRNATFTSRMPRRTLNRYAMSPKSFRVSRESPLLPFLLEACRSCNRTTVKSYLSHNQVEVNGRIVARFDHALSPGDEVAVFPGRRVELLRHPMLRIVYEDEWLIVADKRSGLLSVGTQRERTRTAYYILSEHVKRSDPANRIFVVHRLDRATSDALCPTSVTMPEWAIRGRKSVRPRYPLAHGRLRFLFA